MTTITTAELVGTTTETIKVFNENKTHIFNISVEDNEIGIVTKLVNTDGEVELTMTEKKNGKGLSFDKDLRSISYEKFLNMQILINFNMNYVKECSLEILQPILKKNKRGLVLDNRAF